MVNSLARPSLAPADFCTSSKRTNWPTFAPSVISLQSLTARGSSNCTPRSRTTRFSIC
jgi:hypothetical protein